MYNKVKSIYKINKVKPVEFPVFNIEQFDKPECPAQKTEYNRKECVKEAVVIINYLGSTTLEELAIRLNRSWVQIKPLLSDICKNGDFIQIPFCDSSDVKDIKLITREKWNGNGIMSNSASYPFRR